MAAREARSSIVSMHSSTHALAFISASPTTAAGDPTGNTQRNHRCAEGSAYTVPDGHIHKGGDGWVICETVAGYCSTDNIEASEKRCLDA